MKATVTGWVLGSIFLITGILNALLVHPVPGAFYMLLSLAYLPPTYEWLRDKTGLSIPLGLRALVGIVILWGTLAVGDLAEILGL